MKSKFLFKVILVAGFMLVNFSVYQVYGQSTNEQPTKQQTSVYTCPMHPEVIQDHPGNCPKCNMKLVKKMDMPEGEMHQANDSTNMRQGDKNMMHDSDNMEKESMMKDSTSSKQGNMDM